MTPMISKSDTFLYKTGAVAHIIVTPVCKSQLYYANLHLSGTISLAATDRTLTTAATANRCHPSAIREHGNDSTTTATTCR